jgi:adenosylcobinamide-GDP ribazoletransferase
MIVKAVATAFQFLTIIPLRTNGDVSERDVSKSVSFFPLIGALQGFFLALLAFLFLKIMSVDLTAAIVLVFYILITGGFHQDGLSDTFDALSVPSSGDKEKDRVKRLQVMKESTVGSIGVVAIILSLLLKYILMKETLQINNHTEKYFIIVLLPIFSKWAMVTAMYRAKSARKDGIGRSFLEHVRAKQIALATVFLFLLTFMIFYLFQHFMTSFFYWSFGFFMLLFFSEIMFIVFTCLILKYFFTIRFGGLTGDNFGAMHEISEILFLMVVLLWQ